MMRSCAAILVISVMGLAGCEGGGKDVSSAQCNACSGKSYTESDCAKWGAAAGCAEWEFLATVEGCNNGCAFKDCDVPPNCVKDSDKLDATVPDLDPACQGATGLFPDCSLCQGKCNKIKINGLIRHTCPCGAPCPCNFKCGSIDLPVGGTIGSVCAP